MNFFCKNYVVFKHSDSNYVKSIEEELNLAASKDGRKSKLFHLIEPNPYGDEGCEESYDWKIEHWGTQSEAEVVDFYYDEEKDPYTITVTFYTEWSPPIDLYQSMILEGWFVDAMFSEPEAAFVGTFKDGIDTYYDYDFSKGSSWENDIPKELIVFGELKNSYNLFLKNEEIFLDEGEQDDA